MFENPKSVLTPVAWLQAAAKPARQCLTVEKCVQVAENPAIAFPEVI
jgi:hypothetical protein